MNVRLKYVYGKNPVSVFLRCGTFVSVFSASLLDKIFININFKGDHFVPSQFPASVIWPQ